MRIGQNILKFVREDRDGSIDARASVWRRVSVDRRNTAGRALTRVADVDPLVVFSIIVVATVLGTKTRILNIVTGENHINTVRINRVGSTQVAGFDGFGDDSLMNGNIGQVEFLTSSVAYSGSEFNRSRNRATGIVGIFIDYSKYKAS